MVYQCFLSAKLLQMYYINKRPGKKVEAFTRPPRPEHASRSIELGVGGVAPEIVVDEDVGALADEVDSGAGGGGLRGHGAEVAVSFDYGACVFEVEGCDALGPGNGVEEPAAQQGASAVGVGQVFVEQQEVIAEVEICFAGVAHGQ